MRMVRPGMDVPDMETRLEHDLLGDKDVPSSAYYGVHTLRAVENFPITGAPISIYLRYFVEVASHGWGRISMDIRESSASRGIREFEDQIGEPPLKSWTPSP